jgi:hypothetical protein
VALDVAARPKPEPRNPAPALVAAVLLLAAIAGAWWYSKNAATGPAVMTLTPEAKAYVPNLKLAGVEMKASESMMAGMVVEITGEITNAGDRELRQVDLYCVFYDSYNQVVLRQPVAIVRQKDGVLKPGETRAFRLPFDSLPQSWNQGMPQLVIGQILF